MTVPAVKTAAQRQADSLAVAESLKQQFPGIPFVGALSLGGLQMEGNGKSAQYPVVAIWGIPDPGGIYVVSHSKEDNHECAYRSSVNTLRHVPKEAGSPQFAFAFAR